MTKHSKTKPENPEESEQELTETSEVTEETTDGADAMSKLESDVEKFRDLALRWQADLDNYRKRAAREKEEALRYANTGLLERLLPIIDNFELGLSAAKAEGENSPVFQGMSMVLKQLEDFLSESGVETVDATGKVFDPNKHEAIGQEPSEEIEDGHVIRQLRKGYILRDRLLRPSSVYLSTGSASK